MADGDQARTAEALTARLRAVLARLTEDAGRVPEPTPPRGPAELTIGIATRDDYDGAWFTIASLRLHHRELMYRVEILLLDDHPEGLAAPALKALDRIVPNLRYLPVTGSRPAPVRDLLFRHAQGETVLVLDGHVLLAPGALAAVLDHFAVRPGCRDLVQGPLLAEDTYTVAGCRLDPVWEAGTYGLRADDPRAHDLGGPAFDIEMQDLGLFACRRDAWPGLNPWFRGLGGEEGYLHEKVRRGGGRTLCLPALRWMRRRPSGVPCPPAWDDRIRDHLIAWRELGWDDTPVREHFRGVLGEAADRILAPVDAELAHPASRFDGALCPCPDDRPDLWRRTSRVFAEAGFALTRVPAPAGPVPGLRACLRYAAEHGWRNALVADLGGRPAPDAAERLAACPRDGWDVLPLGGLTAYAAGGLEKAAALLDAAAWTERHGPFDRWLADHLSVPV